MERSDIVIKLSEIFKKVFENDTLEVYDELTANDVDNWDSLSHMLLIKEIEDSFVISFKLKELNKMRNVGDMVDIIASKI
ncbi:MAG: acyl carrier protein [Bacteroidales bacterium]|nr:acyl carrier protein [Bacteroidales bacterium]